MQRDQVQIRCPACFKGRLLDAVSHASAAKLQLYGPRQLNKAEWIIKCPKCGQKIGIALQKLNMEMQRTGA